MKALVLCGGIPQIELIKQLKSRSIETVLLDMNEKVAAREFADKFYPVSVLDIEAVKEVAIKEKADFLITVCADQVLEVVAIVAEELGLPWYIDAKTANNVSKKSYMKKIFWENEVPTSKYVIMDELDFTKIAHLEYPLIVKPVDSYSSRGVRKVLDKDELISAFNDAVTISRTKTAVVEEFVEGDELTVDVYIENGVAHVLSIAKLDKIGGDRFVIYRSSYPAKISAAVESEIKDTAQKIATAFGLKNSPMLIQLINNGEKISVVEFCARTGGGVKFRHIKRVSGFDVVKAVIDLTLGAFPHVEENKDKQKYVVNEFLYAKSGVLDHIEGFEELMEKGVISEFYKLKGEGTEFGEIKSSGDRLAAFTIETYDRDELIKNHALANATLKAIAKDGSDLIRHDLMETLDI